MRFLMFIIILGCFSFSCDNVESTSSENPQGGFGVEAPISSQTNALSHGSNSSHPQTFGQGKFSPKGGYAPTSNYSYANDDEETTTKAKPDGE